MKQKLKIANALLGLSVLFIVLFQSLHSFEHLAKQFSKETCFHQYSEKATLTHSHYWEKCHVCEFAFSSFKEINFAEISFVNSFIYCQISFYHTSDKIPYYSGSSFSLRGPPVV